MQTKTLAEDSYRLETEAQKELFKKGYKPVLYVSHRQLHIKKHYEGFLASYPYIEVITDGHLHFDGKANYLFFRWEKDKQAFKKKNDITDDAIAFDDNIIGEAIGYPKFAIDVYPIDDIARYAFIDYHTWAFACLKKDAVKALHYMYEKYPIPKHLGHMVRIEFAETNETFTIEDNR